MSADNDPIAYLNLVTNDKGGYDVQANISGRHGEKDAPVLEILKKLQLKFGGVIRDDDNAM